MGFTTSFYSDWGLLSTAAAVTSVLISILLIQVARIFNLANFEQMAKAELSYAATTFLIVIMIISIIQFGEGALAGGVAIPGSASGGSLAKFMYLSSFNIPYADQASIQTIDGQPLPTTLIDWVKLSIKTPATCINDFLNTLYLLSIPVETGASVYMEVFMSDAASGYAFKFISERINNAVNSLTFMDFMYYFLNHTLNFIKNFAGFFFSVGVVLRAIPPTRGAGAYIMALSFGLYFIFPLAYLMIATVALPHTQATIISPTVRAASFSYICTLPPAPDVTELNSETPSIARAFELRTRIAANSPSLTDMLEFRFTEIIKHITSAICLFPFMAAIILMTFVLNGTTLLGGKIPEVGRGLVKLI